MLGEGAKPIRWTPHALERLAAHELDDDNVRLTIVAPEFVVPSRPSRRIHMRRYTDAALGQDLLLRVAIEETPTEIVVLTVYRTSTIRTYPKGLVP